MAGALKLSDELIELAKPYAATMHRSIPEQIEHWAWLGKTAEEDPELPVQFIQDTLLAVEEAKAGLLTEYQWHVRVEEREPGVWLIRTALDIPENEAWMHTAAARQDLQEALAWA